MISYKDQTWCASDCANTACFRNFTPDERARAIRWWGGEDFPMAQADFRATCDDYLKEKAA